MQSGEYNLAYSINNCWLFDTIQIQIDEEFQIFLGMDTLIKLSDSIQFIIDNDYDSYLWSDGTETNSILVKANSYGAGNFPIWVYAMNGVCESSDTISLTIIDGSGTMELNKETITISPIPCHDILSITCKNIQSSYNIFIFDLNSHLVHSSSINSERTILNVESLIAGQYILLIDDKHGNYYSSKFSKF